jgi:group I intron endonuclease
MHHFIYETTNLINGKKYIGKHSTTNIGDGYLGSGTLLLRAIKKYGRKNFKRKILLIVGSEEEAYLYEEKLVTREIFCNNKYYNLTGGGEGGKNENSCWYGRKHTEESKRKISENHADVSGKNHPRWGKGDKIRGEDNPFYGKHHSEKTKEKMRKSRKDICKGENHGMYNKKHTKESKQKMSESTKGKKHPMYGKCHSEETKKKMSESAKNRWRKLKGE